MECPVCGTVNEAGSAFCYSCGASLRGAGAVGSVTGQTVSLSRAEPEGPLETDITEREETTDDLFPDNPYARPVPPPLREPAVARVYDAPPSSGAFLPASPDEGHARVYSTPSASPPPYVVAAPPLMARTSNLAMFALILGILSWTLAPLIAAVGAIICGHMGRREILAANGRLTGAGMATAGLILGYLNLGLSLVGLVFLCSVFGWLASA